MEEIINTVVGCAFLLAILVGVIIISQKREKAREAQRKIEMHIICPNCKFEGQGRQLGGVNGCLVAILLCCGILPGILYLMMNEHTGVACPRCGMRIR